MKYGCGQHMSVILQKGLKTSPTLNGTLIWFTCELLCNFYVKYYVLDTDLESQNVIHSLISYFEQDLHKKWQFKLHYLLAQNKNRKYLLELATTNRNCFNDLFACLLRFIRIENKKMYTLAFWKS